MWSESKRMCLYEARMILFLSKVFKLDFKNGKNFKKVWYFSLSPSVLKKNFQRNRYTKLTSSMLQFTNILSRFLVLWCIYCYRKKELYCKKNSLTLPLKAEFTHLVSACVSRIALQFFITYLGFAQSRYVIKNPNAMQKMHVETGCVNAP